MAEIKVTPIRVRAKHSRVGAGLMNSTFLRMLRPYIGFWWTKDMDKILDALPGRPYEPLGNSELLIGGQSQHEQSSRICPIDQHKRAGIETRPTLFFISQSKVGILFPRDF